MLLLVFIGANNLTVIIFYSIRSHLKLTITMTLSFCGGTEDLTVYGNEYC